MLTISSDRQTNIGRSAKFRLCITEGEYSVRTITSEAEKTQAYQLRHRVFCQELNWVTFTKNALEIDTYDNDAVFFGVFDRNDKLLAFLRLIMPASRFMVEEEFLQLVDVDHKIRKEKDTAEISRMCVAPEARTGIMCGNFGIHGTTLLLFKGVYCWCRKNRIHNLYAVAEQKVYRLFCAKGFPYKLIGKPHIMPDGIVAVAVLINWGEFERINEHRRPELLFWFNQGRPAHAPLQWQQPEPCLPRQAFS